MPSIPEIRLELCEEFEGIEGATSASFVDSCAAIGAYLSNDSGVALDKALKDLNDLMFNLIDGRLKATIRGGMPVELRRENIGKTAADGAFKPKGTQERDQIAQATSLMTTTGTDPFKKVLTTVLFDFETAINYPNNMDRHFHPRYVGFVKPEVFLGNVAQGAQWKDVGASPEHGEFTHRLQWFAIAQSDTVPKNKAGEIYRGIGQYTAHAKAKDGIGQDQLWARLCDRPKTIRTGDRPGGTTRETDFRCPEYLNTYIRNGEAKFPLLSAFIQARYAKRAGLGEGENFPSIGEMRNYTAKKLFGIPTYGGLGPLQKQEVDKIVGQDKTGILLPV